MIRVADRPLEYLHAAHRSAGHRIELRDAEMIDEQFLGIYHVP